MGFNNSPTLEQAITQAISNAFSDVMTSIPAKVIRVDANGLVAVQPLIQKMTQAETGEWISEEYPTINGCPVFSLGAGGFRMTLPVAVNDEVLLIFSSSSVERWKQVGGGPVDPNDPRRFNINDAVVLPGLRSLVSAWTGGAVDAATVGKDGGPQVVMRASTIELGGSAAVPPVDPAILGNVRKLLEDTFLTALQTQLTAAAAGATAAAAAATNQAAICLGPLLPLGVGFTAEAAGLTSLAAGLTAAVAAVASFKAGLPTTLSNIVKVK